MSQVEYLVALISIVVGLALTDLAQSFRELIRPGHAVKWDGLPLAWSASVFVLTVVIWWQGFNVLEDPSGGDVAGPHFLTFLLYFLVLYLCCAFALPDADWKRSTGGDKGGFECGVDLETFYFSTGHRKWFFGLLIGFWVTVGTANQLRLEPGGAIQRLDLALPTVGMAALTAVPIVTDRRWAHWVVVGILGGAIGAVAVRDILL